MMTKTGALRDWTSAKTNEFLPHGSLRARFALGAFWSLMGAVISRGFALAASIVCARFLGKTHFGELGMIQSTVGTFGLFAGLGLGLTATKYVAELRTRDVARVSRILALSAVAAAASSAAMAFLLIVTASYLSKSILADSNLAGPLVAAAGLVFFGALNGAQTGALAGFEAFRTISRVSICAGLASFPLVAIGVWRWGLKGAVWGLVASMAVNWLLNHLALRRECVRFGIRYDFGSFHKEWPVLFNFSLPAFLASVVVGPAMWVCNMILVHQPGGYSLLGIYTAADRWRLFILFVPTSVFGMVVPVLSNLYGARDLPAFNRVFKANLHLCSALALAFALIVMMFSKLIMAAYGGSFRSGWPVLVILSLSALPEGLNAILGHPLIVTDAMWWRFAFDFFLAVMLVGLAFFFIPKWGATGLAGSYLLTFSAVSTALYFFGVTRTPRTLREGESPAVLEHVRSN